MSLTVSRYELFYKTSFVRIRYHMSSVKSHVIFFFTLIAHTIFNTASRYHVDGKPKIQILARFGSQHDDTMSHHEIFFSSSTRHSTCPCHIISFIAQVPTRHCHAVFNFFFKILLSRTTHSMEHGIRHARVIL